MTSTERDPVLGARRSARALALRRAHDVLVLDDGSEACPEPLWLRVRERARHAARLRVVMLGAGRGEGTDGAPAQDGGPGRAAGRPGDASGGAPAVERRVATSLPVSLVALDDTVVLVARPGRTRAVTDRDAVAALRALAESEWDRARPDGDARGTILMHGGNDSYMEEFLPQMLYLREHGYEVFLYEGPGQGSVIRDQGVPFTWQWEKTSRAGTSRSMR